jgi:hypothetical protein
MIKHAQQIIDHVSLQHRALVGFGRSIQAYEVSTLVICPPRRPRRHLLCNDLNTQGNISASSLFLQHTGSSQPTTARAVITAFTWKLRRQVHPRPWPPVEKAAERISTDLQSLTRHRHTALSTTRQRWAPKPRLTSRSSCPRITHPRNVESHLPGRLDSSKRSLSRSLEFLPYLRSLPWSMATNLQR